MGILTGREEGIKVLGAADYGFIGTLTDYARGWYLKGINNMFTSIYVFRYVNTIFTTNRYLYT